MPDEDTTGRVGERPVARARPHSYAEIAVRLLVCHSDPLRARARGYVVESIERLFFSPGLCDAGSGWQGAPGGVASALGEDAGKACQGAHHSCSLLLPHLPTLPVLPA